MNEKDFKTFIQKFFKNKYKYRNVDEIPYKMRSNIIYIVQEGTQAETLSFMCPCGCKQPVYLNLIRDTVPCWTYKIERRKVSIFPSIVRKNGCKSHYCITKGEVIWI